MRTTMDWWAYVHTNGHLQIKRYFDELCFKDADESPFVVKRTGIMKAEGRDDAEAQAKVILNIK